MKWRVQGAPIENTRPARQICLSTPRESPRRTSRGASPDELAAPPLTRTPPRTRPSCARAGVSATTRWSKKTLGSHASLAAVWA